ncbi:MAG: SET domain-containing protein [Magnetococcales bacterium]|nr:SET domain-containing protein [Magnetococcales bacterium]
MLVVKTVLKPSAIHGIGLFAAQLIEAGELVGTLTPWDRVVERAGLPQILDDFYMDYAIFKNGDRNLFQTYCDNMRFMNHSKTPNCLDQPNGDCVALARIRPGEELTCDYALFSTDPRYR